MHYNYIIAGGGCAGLSLLARMIKSQKLADKKILLIDKELRNANDRTWCFWETEPGFFESIVFRSWDHLHFHGHEFQQLLNIAPYRYKMVRGIDFYTHVWALIRQTKEVDVETGTITRITSHDEKAEVEVNGRIVTGDYVFNSVLFQPPDLKNYYDLKQHFKGWVIRCDRSVFNSSVATLMDFRVDQQHGTTFVYVLPFDEHRALVEFTLFTRDLLSPQEYDQALTRYITRYVSDQFHVEEMESGVIPMTNYPFKSHEGRVYHLGTAGGQTKASTGYTFQFIQRHTQQLVESLITTGAPGIQKTFMQKRFSFYDSILLHILDKRKLEGKTIFTDLFKNGDPQTVLRFLDNETTLMEDLSIMYRLPTATFAKAAWNELTK